MKQCRRRPGECARLFAPLAVTPLLVLALLAGTYSAAASAAASQADSSAPVSVDVTVSPSDQPADTEVPVLEPTEELPPATDVPAPTVESPPTETPVEPEPTAITVEPSLPAPTEPETPAPTVAASETPVPSAAVTGTASATPSPSLIPTLEASLSYTLDNAIRCQPSTAVTEVRHGSSIDYRCSLALSMEGQNLPESIVGIDWQVKAGVDEGWTVQLRNQNAGWQDAASAVVITSREEFATSTLKENVSGAHGLSVDLRISRNRCVTDGGNVTLVGGAVISLTGAPGTIINIPSRTSASADVAPGLVPIPDPAVNFSGTLELGSVNLVPAMDAGSTSGAITLDVSGLDQSCGARNVMLYGEALSGDAGSTIDAGNLRLVAVNGQPVAAGSCALGSGCMIATVESRAGADDIKSYVLQFELDIPTGTTPGSFTSSIRASVDAP